MIETKFPSYEHRYLGVANLRLDRIHNILIYFVRFVKISSYLNHWRWLDREALSKKVVTSWLEQTANGDVVCTEIWSEGKFG